ncbi:MAG: hypothetical protein JJD93_15580, partial [Ilumatobacteraceae bacterium]|nr:hypothetical protein [Ilumatobacteraceae bacterium]
MTIIQRDPGAAQVAPVTAGRRTLRLFALLAGAAAVFGTTVGVRSLVSADRNTAGSVSTVGLVMPRSAEIEHAWGVQIKSVTLLASTGVIDVRYTVLDDGKATRLHTDGRTGLPSLRTSDHGTVPPDSVMFHFHSKAEEVAGQGYD